jgi:hypothetical protein
MRATGYHRFLKTEISALFSETPVLLLMLMNSLQIHVMSIPVWVVAFCLRCRWQHTRISKEELKTKRNK